MQLEDPVIRKYAEAAVKWQSVSRVNSDLGVARAIGDADFKLGPRMARFPWNFPKGVARTFTADIVNGEPDIGEVRERFSPCACVFFGVADPFAPCPSLSQRRACRFHLFWDSSLCTRFHPRTRLGVFLTLFDPSSPDVCTICIRHTAGVFSETIS